MAENLHELLGRTVEELDRLRKEYRNLLGLLSLVCKGDIHPSRVNVDEAAQAWSVMAAVVPDAEPIPEAEPVTLTSTEDYDGADCCDKDCVKCSE